MALEPTTTQALSVILPVAIPLLYLAGSLAQQGVRRASALQWAWAHACATLAVVCAALTAVWVGWHGPATTHGPTLLSLAGLGEIAASVRIDAVGACMLVLVTFIGWVIVRYSRRYMDGDADSRRYLRWLMATLAAVTLLVVANNLALLALAWLGTSLALHQLLVYYSDRPQALIAAHKKFLISRLADACLLGAIVLIGATLGTLEIDQVLARAQGLAQWPAGLQVAAVLVVCSALLKCAQLPVHGWLIQVMEAPTPVSALLHAGVVNLGGFLLIRLSGLVSGVPAAEGLLVIVGSVTAVVAALVMTTRISVKVMLAWSTCAQMGFMLMQCGLGAYELALLHLVAHSLYKAHAFLAAGGAVEQATLRRMAPPAKAAPGPGALLLSVAAALAAVAGAALWVGVDTARSPSLWVFAVIVALALTSLLAGRTLRIGGLWTAAFVAAGVALPAVYFALHGVFGAWVDRPSALHTVQPWQLGWVLASFTALFALQSLVRARPQGTVARRLYPWLYAGLYLDELFTRLTFRVWPARLPQGATEVATAAEPSMNTGAR